jgi:hypothetical protein
MSLIHIFLCADNNNAIRQQHSFAPSRERQSCGDYSFDPKRYCTIDDF